MLEPLITSKTRIKLMLKFFLNSNNMGHLRGLETEFGESTNAIRQELNRFEAAGLLESENIGNRKIFRANTNHPLFSDISNMMLKHIGVDIIIKKVLNRLNNLNQVYLLGDLAHGIDSKTINFLLIGDGIDLDYVRNVSLKAQEMISRNVHYAVLTPDEFEVQLPFIKTDELLLVYKK